MHVYIQDLVSKLRLKLKVIDDTSIAMRSLKADVPKNNLLNAPKVYIYICMYVCLRIFVYIFVCMYLFI
jgi:hypothetical protein